MKNKKKILFVCLGNICRSPSAEAVFTAIVEKEGVAKTLKLILPEQAAGTLDGLPTSVCRIYAVKRGYNLTSIARQFNPDSDFDRFDMIIAMDDENVLSLKSMARDENDLKKIYKMTDFSKEWNYKEVPDPYYGGEEGFELVLDLLEDATRGLLEKTTR